MARTVYYVASSLDGFIATLDHSLDWLLGRSAGDGGPMDYDTFIGGVGALCLGANTYAWVHRESRDAVGNLTQAWPYRQPCWVFSHRTPSPWPGADIRPTAEPIPVVHEAMATIAGDRDVWVVGGGQLAGRFLDHGLLDEVVVNIAPVTLGSGRPLLPRRAGLRCLETAASGEFVAARYQVVR
jgi:dihydrofolate reductase